MSSLHRRKRSTKADPTQNSEQEMPLKTPIFSHTSHLSEPCCSREQQPKMSAAHRTGNDPPTGRAHFAYKMSVSTVSRRKIFN